MGDDREMITATTARPKKQKKRLSSSSSSPLSMTLPPALVKALPTRYWIACRCGWTGGEIGPDRCPRCRIESRPIAPTSTAAAAKETTATTSTPAWSKSPPSSSPGRLHDSNKALTQLLTSWVLLLQLTRYRRSHDPSKTTSGSAEENHDESKEQWTKVEWSSTIDSTYPTLDRWLRTKPRSYGGSFMPIGKPEAISDAIRRLLFISSGNSTTVTTSITTASSSSSSSSSTRSSTTSSAATVSFERAEDFSIKGRRSGSSETTGVWEQWRDLFCSTLFAVRYAHLGEEGDISSAADFLLQIEAATTTTAQLDASTRSRLLCVGNIYYHAARYSRQGTGDDINRAYNLAIDLYNCSDLDDTTHSIISHGLKLLTAMNYELHAESSNLDLLSDRLVSDTAFALAHTTYEEIGVMNGELLLERLQQGYPRSPSEYIRADNAMPTDTSVTNEVRIIPPRPEPIDHTTSTDSTTPSDPSFSFSQPDPTSVATTPLKDAEDPSSSYAFPPYEDDGDLADHYKLLPPPPSPMTNRPPSRLKRVGNAIRFMSRARAAAERYRNSLSSVKYPTAEDDVSSMDSDSDTEPEYDHSYPQRWITPRLEGDWMGSGHDYLASTTVPGAEPEPEFEHEPEPLPVEACKRLKTPFIPDWPHDESDAESSASIRSDRPKEIRARYFDVRSDSRLWARRPGRSQRAGSPPPPPPIEEALWRPAAPYTPYRAEPEPEPEPDYQAVTGFNYHPETPTEYLLQSQSYYRPEPASEQRPSPTHLVEDHDPPPAYSALPCLVTELTPAERHLDPNGTDDGEELIGPDGDAVVRREAWRPQEQQRWSLVYFGIGKMGTALITVVSYQTFLLAADLHSALGEVKDDRPDPFATGKQQLPRLLSYLLILLTLLTVVALAERAELREPPDRRRAQLVAVVSNQISRSFSSMSRRGVVVFQRYHRWRTPRGHQQINWNCVSHP